MAGDGYSPPRLILWPIVAGLAAVVVCLVVAIAVSSANSSSPQSTWRDHHAATIQKLAKDETALLTDESPAVGDGQRLVDWKRFESDVAAASALPNPGGSATTPWREMLNDYATASNDVVTALTTNDTSAVSEAERDLAAGVAAARQFDQAIGINASSGTAR